MTMNTTARTVAMIILTALSCLTSVAQDSLFRARIYNKEYDITLHINLYEEAITIPGQSILGKVYGYLKNSSDSRAWIIMGVQLADDGRTASLDIINDYGSEDLTATLTVADDNTYTLTQRDGSTIKVASKGKWVKLPKTMTFRKKE